MTILFLTSGLEPGRDGVGDYTRRLAAECLRQNHDCALIALNDPYVSGPRDNPDTASGSPIPTLRLPASLAWDQRIGLARDFRARRSVDWISLQCVAYGFDRKGIVRNLARHLGPIVADRPVHLMFHELWIGAEKSSPLKDRLMGRIQRHHLQKLVRQLQPRSVTTSNPFYLSLLENIGVPAGELPLFGNIPFHPLNAARAAFPAISQGLFFGSLHPEWKPEPFMSIWIAAAAKAQKRPHLLSVGRRGAAGEIVWKKLRRTYAHAVQFIDRSEGSAPAVSEMMQLADFGLATSPWHLLGKSGSVAAMLDHGLPVIVTRDEAQPTPSPSRPDDPLLHRCDAALAAKLLTGLPKRPPQDRVQEITHDFIRLLQEDGR